MTIYFLYIYDYSAPLLNIPFIYFVFITFKTIFINILEARFILSHKEGMRITYRKHYKMFSTISEIY